MKSILALVLLAAFVPSVHAQQKAQDGNSLVSMCPVAIDLMTKRDASSVAPRANTAVDAGLDAGYCIGLIHGIVFVEGNFLELPKSYTPLQGLRIVQKYLQDHPEQLNEPDSTLVVRALMAAFPKPLLCPDGLKPNGSGGCILK